MSSSEGRQVITDQGFSFYVRVGLRCFISTTQNSPAENPIANQIVRAVLCRHLDACNESHKCHPSFMLT